MGGALATVTAVVPATDAPSGPVPSVSTSKVPSSSITQVAAAPSAVHAALRLQRTRQRIAERRDPALLAQLLHEATR